MRDWRPGLSALSALLSCAIAAATQEVGPGSGVDFEREIEPIFAAHCIECHGPEKRKQALRLDERAAAFLGGDSGEPGIVPGDSARSEVLRRLDPDDEGDRMPPRGEPLTAAQIALVRRWIDEGASWPEGGVKAASGTAHWSFQPLADPAPPSTGDPWVSSPIDAFILDRLKQEDLAPSPEADRVTLIRRLYLDVQGLLPTPEQVDHFVQDARDDAWEQLVDEVLASPRYGERWAQHWLDVVQYADSHGFEMNNPRPNAYHYRDWVIGALNDDLPYDRFIFEQLAGDTVGADAATGFLVAGAWDQVKSEEPAYTALQRQDELTAMVNTAGTAFLGLTLGCARCHNHKFDPVLQRDFYSLTAVFAGVRHGERALEGPRAAQRRSELSEVQQELQTLRAQLPRVRPAVTPTRNEEHFEPRRASAVRMRIDATQGGSEPCVDELEIWSGATNVALTARPSSSGDYANNPKHRLEHINDGEYGNSRSWISSSAARSWIQLDLAEPARIERVTWGRDRTGQFSDRTAVAYTLEVADASGAWTAVSGSYDRLAFGSEGGEEGVSLVSPALVAQLGAALERERELAATTLPAVYAGRFEPPGPTHRLYRGDVLAKREAVAPDTLSVLGSLGLAMDAPEAVRRAALARSITDPGNPLTSRVMANRVWYHHFGAGIVSTPGDLGANGGEPTHPGLLDWLAHELMRGEWSLKGLHRAILLSSTYRQSSRPHAAGLARDADARLLWRFPPRRLEAEVIRDTMLQLSGSLDLSMGGPGYSLYEPNENYVRVYTPKATLERTEWRRMVYMHKVRMERAPLFGSFDVPDAGQVCPKRSRSTTAIQALSLFNDEFVLDQARRMAAALSGGPLDPMVATYRAAYGRLPGPEELAAARAFAKEHGLTAFSRAILNSNELVFLP